MSAELKALFFAVSIAAFAFAAFRASRADVRTASVWLGVGLVAFVVPFFVDAVELADF